MILLFDYCSVVMVMVSELMINDTAVLPIIIRWSLYMLLMWLKF